MTNIKITDKAGVTLKTAGKYCSEDIDVTIDESLLGGGGLDLTLPPVSNVAVSNGGVLTFTASDTSELKEYNPVISYLVDVNGNELTTRNTSLNIFSYLIEGENTITITAKATLTINTESNEIQETIQYEIPAEPVTVVLETTLPKELDSSSAAAVGTNIYLFGGYTPNTVSLTDILKFDSTSETITTLSAVLPSGRRCGAVAAVNTNAYLFGGYGGSYLNQIIKVKNL